MVDPKPTKDKVYLADVTLAIGMLSVQGNLFTVKKPNAGAEEKTKMICPDCNEVHVGLSQQYACNEDSSHGPFKPGECAKGKEVEDEKTGAKHFVKVSKEDLEAAKTSELPERELNLQVHNRSDVEAHTFPSGNAYVFMPTGKGPLYGVLVELLKKRTDIALIAKVNMRQADHLVQVELGMDGQLVVREIIWPEDAKDFAPVYYEKPSAKNLTMAETLIEASIEDFKPEEYGKDSRTRIAAVIEAAKSGKPPKATPSKAKRKSEADQDLSEILAAALAAKKAS